MAKAPGSEFHEKLSDLTECSICAEIFTNPKILPCVHTFCLHCLERHEKGKRPGNQMGCPICRTEFAVPEKGLSELPNNFFIAKIVEIGKLATVNAKEAVCELCSEETAVAKRFCIDCQKKICDRCIAMHGTIKQCLSHKVVDLGSQLTFPKLNICNSYCEHHPKELVTMYCYEDNVPICLICFAESHQSHRCSNIDKAAGQFTEQLKADLRKVASRSSECEEASQKLEKVKMEFAEEVLRTEEDIRKSGDELKKLIDQHTEMLVQNVRIVRDRNIKYFETIKQDVDRFNVMSDSYKRYCNEILTTGSPVDICRAANQMHTRAIDLEKLSASCSASNFNCDKVSFHCANVEILMKQHGINNFVGELTVTKSSDRIAIQLRANDHEYQDTAKIGRKSVMHAAKPDVQKEMMHFHGAQAMKDTSQTGFSKNKREQRDRVDAVMALSSQEIASISADILKKYSKKLKTVKARVDAVRIDVDATKEEVDDLKSMVDSAITTFETLS